VCFLFQILHLAFTASKKVKKFDVIFELARGRKFSGGNLMFLRCLHRVFKSARTDDASFSNVRALADASLCKAANKSTI